MAIVYFNGGISDEQAKGPRLDSGKMRAFAVRRDQPTQMISLGGHRLDDAPTYNTTEGKIAPEYKFKGGRNVVVEHQLSGDITKSVTFNLMLPDRFVSVTDLIYTQQKNCDYDLFFVPHGCDDGCDEFFWKGNDMILSSKQIQNSIIGWDDNEGPINQMRTARISGGLEEYHGTKLTTLTPQASAYALYATLVVEDDTSCLGCGCPYQTLVRGGVGDGAGGDATLEYTTDGGLTWSAITTTALGADMIITDLKYIGGYLVVGYSDVAQGVGTDGGVAYSFGVGGALVVSTMNVASTGVQTLEVAGNKIYAFGTAGQVYLSCDNGLTFTLNTAGPAAISETILDSSYDEQLGVIFLACTTAEAWTFDQVAFIEIDSDFSPTGATDLESVEVLRAGGGVAFGGADGGYYESWNFEALTVGDWTTNAFGTGAVGAIVGNAHRTIIGHGADIMRRSILTEQQWDVYSEAPVGIFTAIESAMPLDGEGLNYFIGVTTTGETFLITKCDVCLPEC